MKITACRFVAAAHGPEGEPSGPGADVVFLGRSNVGKSSLINRLLGVRGLARTSSTPGRTQSVNFYRINERYWFVDLPGYGYARAPEAVRRSWGPMVEGFLERRRGRIAIAILVLDARREPTELDGVMRDWLEARGIRYVAAVTKADKLSGNGRARALRRAPAEAVLVSATTGMGVQELWRHLDHALDGAAAKRKGSS